jgi:hypothetical protein
VVRSSFCASWPDICLVNSLAKLINVSLSFDGRQWLKTTSPLAPTTSLDDCGVASRSEHIQLSLGTSGSELETCPILHFLTDHLDRTRGVPEPSITCPPVLIRSRPSLADLIRRTHFFSSTHRVSRALCRHLYQMRIRKLPNRRSVRLLFRLCFQRVDCAFAFI